MKSRDKADTHGDGQCHYDMSQVKLRLLTCWRSGASIYTVRTEDQSQCNQALTIEHK